MVPLQGLLQGWGYLPKKGGLQICKSLKIEKLVLLGIPACGRLACRRQASLPKIDYLDPRVFFDIKHEVGGWKIGCRF